MNNPRKQGMILVVIWAMLAVAVTVLAEAHAGQSPDTTPKDQGASEQFLSKTTGEPVFGVLNADNSAPAKVANTDRQSTIKEIRKLVNSVNLGMTKGIFKTSQKRFEDCEGGYEVYRRITVDAKGVVRRYEMQGGSEDHLLTFQHYYDESGRISFVYIIGGAVNGTRIQHRIYFDENGKRIFESHKNVTGPGYPGFSDYPDNELSISRPAEDFAAASQCPEIKTKAKHLSQ
jgi:hypothetical protein